MIWLKQSAVFTQAWIVLAAVMVFTNGAQAAEEAPKVLRLGVRGDCPPFSYYDKAADTYRGYSVDLCLEIARNASAYLNYRGFEFAQVTAQDRFRKLHGEVPDESIDILCEATTVTQERMRRFGSTMYTFISGASLMYLPNTATAEKLTVGALKGTTTEKEIRSILDRQIDIGRPYAGTFLSKELNTHQDCFEAFREGKINIYIADREILLALSAQAQERKKKQQLIVSRNYYTIEPYALFMRTDDHQLRYIANLTLSEIFKEDIHRIFVRNFPGSRMNDSLRQLFRLQQLLRGTDPLPE